MKQTAIFRIIATMTLPAWTGLQTMETVPTMQEGKNVFLVTGDVARNKELCLPGGGSATVKIVLPKDWNRLMAERGYAPLESFKLKSDLKPDVPRPKGTQAPRAEDHAVRIGFHLPVRIARCGTKVSALKVGQRLKKERAKLEIDRHVFARREIAKALRRILIGRRKDVLRIEALQQNGIQPSPDELQQTPPVLDKGRREIVGAELRHARFPYCRPFTVNTRWYVPAPGM